MKGEAQCKLLRLFVGDFEPAQWTRIMAETDALARSLSRQEQMVVQFVKPGGKVCESLRQENVPARIDINKSYWSCARSLRRMLAECEPRVVHAHGVGAALIAGVARLGFRKKPEIVYEIHGAVAYESAYRHQGEALRWLRFALLYVLETMATVLCDRIVLVSHEIEKYYPIVKLKTRIAVSRALMPFDEIGHDAAVPGDLKVFINDARAAGQQVIVYSGNAAAWQKVRLVMVLIKQLVGTGQARAVILTTDPEAFKRQLCSISDGGWYIKTVRSDQVVACLSQCDAGVILRDDVALNRVASPTKLFDYIGAGLCVVTNGGVKAAEEYVHAGVIVNIDLQNLDNGHCYADEILEKIERAKKGYLDFRLDREAIRSESGRALMRLYGFVDSDRASTPVNGHQS